MIKHTFQTVDEYVDSIPEERQKYIRLLRETILENLPEGFEEVISYGMIGYVVPHSIYPAGYHANPKLPLPFINLASQKNYIALYHMGIYADKKLLDWFVSEYTRQCGSKPDMGKSCIRFKKPEQIPFQLIGQLSSKISCGEWVSLYTTEHQKGKIKK